MPPNSLKYNLNFVCFKKESKGYHEIKIHCDIVKNAIDELISRLPMTTVWKNKIMNFKTDQ